MLNLKQNDVVRMRLAGQRLTGALAGDPVALVREQGAVQSQDYLGGKWGIGLRVRNASDGLVETAIEAGKILRTHVLRPTWHFVAAEDLRWMLALTGPQIKTMLATYDTRLGIDAKQKRKSTDVILRALEGAKHLTRDELGAEFARGGIRDARLIKLAHLMMNAELDGIVCSGKRRGKDFTYALVDERAPKVAARDRDDALGEIARRYFTGRGPASVQDFSWWSGLRSADAKRAIEVAGKDLTAATYEEGNVWFVERTVPRMNAHAHLLPNYDEYFIGHRDRSAIGRRVRSLKEVAGDQFFAHLVFVNGELVGGWKRLNSKKGIGVKFTMMAKLTPAERKLIASGVDRFGKFLGQEVKAS